MDIEKVKDYRVTKDNALIQKSKHSLSATHQKILAYLIARIDPKDDDRYNYYEFNLTQFCKTCGVDDSNTKYIRAAVKYLRDLPSIEVFENDCYVPYAWISDYEISPKKGTINIQIHFRMKKYLLNLKSHFTTYALYNILGFKSRYSIAIYELLQSYSNLKTLKIEIDDLRDKLCLNDKYTDYKDFKKRVLNVAVDEINSHSDMQVEFKTITVSKRVVAIKFDFHFICVADMLERRANRS